MSTKKEIETMTATRRQLMRTWNIIFSIRPTFLVLTSFALIVIVISFSISKQSRGILESGNRTQNLKYILIWHSYDWAPFDYFGHGMKALLGAKCPISHCYVTQNRALLNDVTYFDAIAFNGRTIIDLDDTDLPRQRSSEQKYIYFNMEASITIPAIDQKWNNFFNWTATHRLDSDIPLPYMRIENKKGEVVGPKPDMKWIEKMNEVPKALKDRLKNKTKAVAWFVSNCETPCQREKHYEKLKHALSLFNLSIDVYGPCGNGNYDCKRSEEDTCDKALEDNYSFYLAYENSCETDYVTEKVLRAMQHYTVPIVYGGADYTRFLPPHSYIDAMQNTPEMIARTISLSMQSPAQYEKFFKWTSHYEYFSTESTLICAVCAALNDETMMKTKTVYADMQRWRSGTDHRLEQTPGQHG